LNKELAMGQNESFNCHVPHVAMMSAPALDHSANTLGDADLATTSHHTWRTRKSAISGWETAWIDLGGEG
jgi:hypothetical protein